MTTFRRTSAIAAIVVLLPAVSAVAASSARGAPVHTKRQAELNILRMPRFFWHAGLHGFIRTRTKTFRTNVTVSCAGGHGRVRLGHVFLCRLRYHRKAAVVRYTALGKYAFKLKFVPHLH